MASADEMTNALDVALATAHAEYKDAVIELATREAAKDEQPLDFWTPSILILRTGGDDGEAEFQRGLQA